MSTLITTQKFALLFFFLEIGFLSLTSSIEYQIETNRNKQDQLIWFRGELINPLLEDTLVFRGLDDEFYSKIKYFQNLKRLDLSLSEISSLPVEVCQLSQLKELILDHNNLKALPNEICKLKKLEVLQLSNNQLDELPEKIGDLKKLRVLNLKKNRFSQFPYGITQLSLLEIVNLKWNFISSIDSNLNEMQSLTCLDLSINKLSIIPSTLATLPNIRYLSLANNHFKFHKNMNLNGLQPVKILNLENNNIHNLPKKFYNLPNLEIFFIGENDIATNSKRILKLKSMPKLQAVSIINKDEPALMQSFNKMGLSLKLTGELFSKRSTCGIGPQRWPVLIKFKK